MHHRVSFWGSATVEYTLAAAFMLAVIAFFLTQTDWQNTLQSLQAALMGGDAPNGSRTLTVRALGDVSGLKEAQRKLRTREICFKSGSCVTLPMIPEKATAADTIGGLGGDFLAMQASVFRDIAAEIEEQGGDSSLSDLIRELASEFGKIGKSFSEADEILAKYNCDVRACNADTFTRGEQYKLGYFLYELPQKNFQDARAAYDAVRNYLSANPDSLNIFPEAKELLSMQWQQGVAVARGVDFCKPDSCITRQSDETEWVPFQTETDIFVTRRGREIPVTNYKANGASLYRTIHRLGGDDNEYYVNGEWVNLAGPIPSGWDRPLHMGFSKLDLNPELLKNSATLLDITAETLCRNGDPDNCEL